MIEILYFASLKENLGLSWEKIDSQGIETIHDIIQQLLQRGEPWRHSFTSGVPVLAAINHKMADLQSPVKENDEVAFFPPVTGG